MNKSDSGSSVTYQTRRSTNFSNPVVQAMLSSNIMNDCSQVKDMFYQCSESKKDSIICDTAQRYFFEICTKKPAGTHSQMDGMR